MLKKLLLPLLAVSLVSLAPVWDAIAATVTLTVEPDGNFTIQNSLGVGIGSVLVLTTGATGFTLNLANPGLSAVDSVYAVDPLGDGRDALILNSTAFGVSIAAPGTTALLGRFDFGLQQPLAITLFPFEELPGFATLSDAYGNYLFPASVAGDPFPTCDAAEGPCPGPLGYVLQLTFVPEPPVALFAAAILLATLARKSMA